MSDFNPMDKVIDNLWIGNHLAALDNETLEKNGIKSILSVMRGKIAIHRTFSRRQILLDDTDDADALVHLPASNHWIDTEIKKGKGVLVHCQAGMSRSATIVAAYLMYSQCCDVTTALDIIRKARPSAHPNSGFMAQLEVFHAAHYQLTRRNKETREFYVQRATKEVLNGDGSALQMDMFAKFPRTPSDSTPATPYPQYRRRIRCKSCRQELATREHMIDHGQVGPSTPATGNTLTPAISRRPSAGETIVISTRETATGEQSSATLIRRLSLGSDTLRRPSLGGGLAAMTPIHTEPQSIVETPNSERERRSSAADSVPRRSFGAGGFGGLAMTPMSAGTADPPPERRRRRSLLGLGDGSTQNDNTVASSALESDESDKEDHATSGSSTITTTTSPTTLSINSSTTQTTPLSSPQELSAQIHPALAALKSSQLISALSSNHSLALEMTPLKGKENGGANALQRLNINSVSPPLLMPNMNCSGYFVEPMKWMDSFLESGNMAGKIVCPNKKCGAKLGNYDWAGVQCSCKEWVVPGFCVHRSKVDEVVV